MTSFPLSPLDSRYAKKVEKVAEIFSEYGLMHYRTMVEIEWLVALVEKKIAPRTNQNTIKKWRAVAENFSIKDFEAIKKIEAATNHDVKAVEYFLRKKIEKKFWPWIHFACTSEDINNLAYGLMLKDGKMLMLEAINAVQKELKSRAKKWKPAAMLCRTHGQTATPSTMGKEIAVFWYRLQQISDTIKNTPVRGKINGATGTFAAHSVAFPRVDWIGFSKKFVEKSLRLTWNPLTTQIEPHDTQVALLNRLGVCGSIYIDLCRDIWSYISLGYFGQKTIAGEVGSSTMPHKVNPIDFENAEGNFKLSRGIGRTLADELPISRWQRDLTDSTLQRNFGLVFGHFFLGLASLQKGLGKLELKKNRLAEDLKNAPEVLTEAVQTALRAHGYNDAYEQLKKFSRGKILTLEDIQNFIEQATLPKAEKNRLKKLTPQTYVGLAEKLVEKFVE